MSTIPEYVLVALEEFRNTGVSKIYDRPAAITYANEHEHYKAATWLYSNGHRYVEALREIGRRLTA